MKRDMELIRLILEYAENLDRLVGGAPTVEIEGYDYVQVQYHIYLCANAGFLYSISEKGLHPQTAQLRELTWKGQEMLATLRAGKDWDPIIREA